MVNGHQAWELTCACGWLVHTISLADATSELNKHNSIINPLPPFDSASDDNHRHHHQGRSTRLVDSDRTPVGFHLYCEVCDWTSRADGPDEAAARLTQHEENYNIVVGITTPTNFDFNRLIPPTFDSVEAADEWAEQRRSEIF